MRARAPLLLLAALAGPAAQAQQAPGDTLLPKAIDFLERNLNDLRQVATRAQEYTAAFTDEISRTACDVCIERDQPIAPHRYAFTVEQAYPGGFAFTHRIAHKGITMNKLDRAEYEWRIPLEKDIPSSVNAAAAHLGKPFTVHHIATVRYLNGRFSIRNVEGVKAREPQIFVDLYGLMGLGRPAFGEQEGFAPDVAANSVGVGLSWYFNPFSRANKANVWLKTGLRASLRTDKLVTSGMNYTRAGLVHTNAIGANGFVVDQAPTMDVDLRVHDLTETTRSTLLTVPLGISKRFALGGKLELALEAEVNYGYAIARNTAGHYMLDQTGTNQRINCELMDATGGTVLTYTAPNAAVVEAATGETVDFYTGRTGAIDGLDTGPRGQLGFAFLPALILYRKGEAKYLIGLRAQWDGNPRNTGTTLDHRWFTGTDDKTRPALGSLTSNSFRLFAGITFGVRL